MQNVCFFIYSTVPIFPPKNISVISPDPHTLLISWKLPSLNAHLLSSINGYIIFYRDVEFSSSADYKKHATSDLHANVTGLRAGTKYVIRVLSYTREGNGVASKHITFTTQEIRKSVCFIRCFRYCITTWQPS